MSLTVSLLFLLFMFGVVAHDGWAVNYNPKSVCALKGSEVTVGCTYTYPSDLQVEVPERVIEGGDVTLTCKTTCSLTVRPTFTWYRNGRCLSSSTDQLHLQPVSREDAGRYRCAVLGQNLRSPEVPLNVRYGPTNISMSISPSGEIVEGSSVTLTCSSDANPPVQNYTWFKKLDKEALQKSTSQIYSISNISSADSGEYQYAPKKALVSIIEIAVGSSVTLTCSSDANPPVQNYTWFKEGGSSPVGSGHGYRARQSGSYYCVAQNEHGSQTSAAVTVTGKGVKSVVLFAAVGVVAGCGCLFVIVAVLCVGKKRQGDSANASERRQKILYNSVTVRSTASDAAPDPDPSSQDVHYSSVLPLRVRNPRNAESSVVTASAFGTDEKVEYASVQYHRGGQD
ncbi:hypothetical protein AOLI_G00235430 [Acnodon oligacanthus]